MSVPALRIASVVVSSSGAEGAAQLEAEVQRDPAAGLEAAALLLEARVAPCPETALVVAACIAERSAVLLADETARRIRRRDGEHVTCDACLGGDSGGGNNADATRCEDILLRRVLAMGCATTEAAALRILMRSCATLCCRGDAGEGAFARRVSLVAAALQRSAPATALALFLEQLPIAHSRSGVRAQDTVQLCVWALHWLAEAAAASAPNAAPPGLFSCMAAWMRSDITRCALKASRNDGGAAIAGDSSGRGFAFADLAAHPLVVLALTHIIAVASDERLEDEDRVDDDAGELVLELVDNFPEVSTVPLWLTTDIDGNVIGGLVAGVSGCRPSRVVGELVFKLANSIHVHVARDDATGSATALAVVGLVVRAACHDDSAAGNRGARRHQHAVAPLLGVSLVIEHFARRLDDEVSGSALCCVQRLVEWVPGMVHRVRNICVASVHEAACAGSASASDIDADDVHDACSEVLTSVVGFGVRVAAVRGAWRDPARVTPATAVFEWIAHDLGATASVLGANDHHHKHEQSVEKRASWEYVDTMLSLLYDVCEELSCGMNDLRDMGAETDVGAAVVAALTRVCHLSGMLHGAVLAGEKASLMGVRTLRSVHRTLAKYAALAAGSVESEHSTNAGDFQRLALSMLQACFHTIGAVVHGITKHALLSSGHGNDRCGRLVAACVNDCLQTIESIVDGIALSVRSNGTAGMAVPVSQSASLSASSLAVRIVVESRATMLSLSESVRAHLAREGGGKIPAVIVNIERRLCRCVFVLVTPGADAGDAGESAHTPHERLDWRQIVHELVLLSFADNIEHIAFALAHRQRGSSDNQDNHHHHDGVDGSGGMHVLTYRCLSSLMRAVALLESPLMEGPSPSHGDTPRATDDDGSASSSSEARDEVVRAVLVHPFDHLARLIVSLLHEHVRQEELRSACSDDAATVSLIGTSLRLATKLIILCVENHEHVLLRHQDPAARNAPSRSMTQAQLKAEPVLWRLLSLGTRGGDGAYLAHDASHNVLDIVASVAHSHAVTRASSLDPSGVGYDTSACVEQILVVVDWASRQVLSRRGAESRIGSTWSLSYCELVRAVFSNGAIVARAASSNGSACAAFVERAVTALTALLVSRCHAVRIARHSDAAETVVRHGPVMVLKSLRAIIECESLWWCARLSSSPAPRMPAAGYDDTGGRLSGTAYGGGVAVNALRNWTGQVVVMSIVSVLVHARSASPSVVDMQYLYKAADVVLAMCDSPFNPCTSTDEAMPNVASYACDMVLHWMERSLNECGVATTVTAMGTTRQGADAEKRTYLDIGEWRSALVDGLRGNDTRIGASGGAGGGGRAARTTRPRSHMLRRAFKRLCDPCC